MRSKMILTAVVIIALIGVCAPAKHPMDDTWAFLVASSGVSWAMQDYCMQADVLHAYHTMLATGIPAERIIVMMHDDIINNPKNPTPGKIINHPGGEDLYAGVRIDYRGKDVSTQNFFNVLNGNKTGMAGIGTERVIEGDDNTNLFVYVSDHGSHQIVYFEFDYLHADALHDHIKEMKDQKKYNKMYFYLEACYGGSMFEDLYEEELNVYAMTAANSYEPSSMCNCESTFSYCLSGEFSIGWTQFLDAQPEGTQLSLDHIFEHTRTFVEKSHVSVYGTSKLGSDNITANQIGTPTLSASHCPLHSSVPATRAILRQYQKLVAVAKDSGSLIKAQTDLDDYIQRQQMISKLRSELIELFVSDGPNLRKFIAGRALPTTRDSRNCYENLVAHFRKHCIHPLLFQEDLAILSNACALQLDINKLKREMIPLCKPYTALNPPHSPIF